MTDTKAQPVTPAEFEEFVMGLDTPEKFQAAAKDGSFKAKVDGYARAYAESQNKVMAELKADVEASVTASVLEMFKNNGVKVDGRLNHANVKAADKGAAYVAGAPGTKTEHIWASASEVILDVVTPEKNRTKDQRARMEKWADFTNAYSESVPSEGGFLVPEQVRADIMNRALEGAVVRPQATVVPMPSSKFRWPAVDFTTEVGSVYGGIYMSWLDEGQSIPASEGAFAAIDLNAHRLGGFASLPNGLIRHAPAVEAWARTAMPEAWRHFEDLAFMAGDGVKKPLGGLHADNPALITVSAEGGQPSATLTWNNVLAMFARLLPESYATAEWDITPDALPEVFSMALPVGTGGSAVMVGEGSGPSKLPMTMLGLPIRWTRKAPGVLGTQGDVSLVDWTKYIVGDTMAMSLDTSEHSSFRTDKTDFRIIGEVDGQPGLLSALTPQNNGPTLSAFIQLATR